MSPHIWRFNRQFNKSHWQEPVVSFAFRFLFTIMKAKISPMKEWFLWRSSQPCALDSSFARLRMSETGNKHCSTCRFKTVQTSVGSAPRGFAYVSPHSARATTLAPAHSVHTVIQHHQPDETDVKGHIHTWTFSTDSTILFQYDPLNKPVKPIYIYTFYFSIYFCP